MNEVRTETVDGVATILLDAPQRRNALTPQMCAELVAAVDAAEATNGVGAILFAAAGPSFCAGADIEVLRSVMPDPLAESAFDSLGSIYDLFRRVAAARLPTIAAVQGSVVGAGINLPLVCDVRIVADDLRVNGFGKASVHPGGGHLNLLQGVDRQLAAWLALFNQSIDAADAVRTGFAWKSVPKDQLIEVATEVARAAARDIELTRRVTATYRAMSDFGAQHDRAVHVERAPQVWSLRRLARTL